MLLALVALVLGFAKPAFAERVPRNRATVMLTLDTSASMEATDVSPSRLEAAKAQARAFVAKLPSTIKVGVIQFASTAAVVASPTTDRSAVDSAIDNLQEGQGTATGDAINLAMQAIKALPTAAGGKAAPAVIVLMSDGSPTVSAQGTDPVQAAESAAQTAGAAKVPVDTIAFGTAEGTVTIQGQTVSVPSDPQTMAELAKLQQRQDVHGHQPGTVAVRLQEHQQGRRVRRTQARHHRVVHRHCAALAHRRRRRSSGVDPTPRLSRTSRGRTP